MPEPVDTSWAHADHTPRPVGAHTMCAHCGCRWPCYTVQLARALDAARATTTNQRVARDVIAEWLPTWRANGGPARAGADDLLAALHDAGLVVRAEGDEAP